MRWVSGSCEASSTTVQLTRGMPGRLGHHWRTKWALSGYHGGNGKGFGVGGVGAGRVGVVAGDGFVDGFVDGLDAL